ncbi:MAG: hypothetical protein NWR47_00920, partial [Aestuariivirgaceae bacterium]|nr:hypothetical protein [Aestuariivirgaceae bacterium]
MTGSLHLAPLLPEWLIYALAGLAILPVLAGLLTRSRGAILRALALAAFTLALLNPVIRNEERTPLSDIAVLIVDQSRSQELGERANITASAKAAIEAAAVKLPATELRTAIIPPGAGQDDGTLAFAALDEALSAIPPERYAGAIFLTDGQIHDVPEKFTARGYNGPLHAVLTGSKTERDRQIVIEQAPRFAIVGSTATIKFQVEETGNPTPAPVRVTVTLEEGEAASLTVMPGQSTEISAEIRHGGRNFLEITAEPLAGELSAANNHAAIITEGIRDRLRVLLVSGEPHAGERTWRNLLKSDPSVDLVHFTILRPPEKQDGTPINELSLIAFPTRELFIDKLDEFDLVVFDSYERRGILPASYLENVAAYVERGGAVLVASGPDYASPLGLYDTPLNTVLPARPTGEVTQEPFKPEITAIGRRHPVTHLLPGSETTPPSWGRWFRLADVAPDTEGETVMSGAGARPLLLLSRKGEGRVALMLSDHAWLWARGFEGGGPQAELLRRLAHWLMKEPELEEEALTATQEGGNLLITRRTLAETADAVTVTTPSGKAEKLNLSETEPGRWIARVAASEPGIWRLTDGKLASLAAVGNTDSREMREIAGTEEKLKPIVEETDGGIVW